MPSTETTSRTYRGHDISTKIVGYSYARNGNPNPTPRLRFDTVFGSARTLKQAKEIIDYAIETGQPLVPSMLKVMQREMRRI
jgi:hypothetical protein